MIRVSAAQLKEIALSFVHYTLPAARFPFTVDSFLSRLSTGGKTHKELRCFSLDKIFGNLV